MQSLVQTVAMRGNFAAATATDVHGKEVHRPTWEHPAALPEGLPNGAEAQDDVQVGAYTLQEEGIQGLPSLPSPFLLSSRPHLIQHPCQLILGEQVGHFTCVSTHHHIQVLHMPECDQGYVTCCTIQLLEQRMQGFQGLRPNHSMLKFGHG